MTCFLCGGPAHPATGSQYTETKVACRECVWRLWRWILGRQGRRPRRGGQASSTTWRCSLENYIKINIRPADASYFHEGMLVRSSESVGILEVLTVDYGKGIVVMKRAGRWKVLCRAVRQLFSDLM